MLHVSYAECPLGFDYLPEVGRCFSFVFEAMNWDNATERCRGIMPGVHLAAIEVNKKTMQLSDIFSRSSAVGIKRYIRKTPVCAI